MYRQDEGKVLNADINGSANIGRKHDGHIFPDILAESRKYHRMAAGIAETVPA